MTWATDGTRPAATILFRERLGMPRRAWLLLGLALLVGVVAIHPFSAVLIVLSWLYSVLRFRRTEVLIDGDSIRVGKRVARLVWLDPATVGRARNPWPWRPFTRTYLGANPIWTSDSVRVLGRDPRGRRVVVAVGTQHRNELVTTLEAAIRNAHQPTALHPAGVFTVTATAGPGWYDDPWAPGAAWRWWDGWRWTAHAAPTYGVRR